MLKIIFAGLLSPALLGGFVSSSGDRPQKPLVLPLTHAIDEKDWREAAFQVSEGDYQTDIDRLVALRARPLDELIAIASQMEAK